VPSRRPSGRLRLFRRAWGISSSTSEGSSGEPKLYRGTLAISCASRNYKLSRPHDGAQLGMPTENQSKPRPVFRPVDRKKNGH
jgi:hypothetical protein